MGLWSSVEAAVNPSGDQRRLLSRHDLPRWNQGDLVKDLLPVADLGKAGASVVVLGHDKVDILKRYALRVAIHVVLHGHHEAEARDQVRGVGLAEHGGKELLVPEAPVWHMGGLLGPEKHGTAEKALSAIRDKVKVSNRRERKKRERKKENLDLLDQSFSIKRILENPMVVAFTYTNWPTLTTEPFSTAMESRKSLSMGLSRSSPCSSLNSSRVS